MNVLQEKLTGFVQKTFFKRKYLHMSNMLYIKSIEKTIKQLTDSSSNINTINNNNNNNNLSQQQQHVELNSNNNNTFQQNNNTNNLSMNVSAKWTVLVLDFHLKKNIEPSLPMYTKFMEDYSHSLNQVTSLYLNLGQTGANFTLLMGFLQPFCTPQAQQRLRYLNIEFSENNTHGDNLGVFYQFASFISGCVNLEAICLNFSNSQLPAAAIFENISLLSVKSLHYSISQNNYSFFRSPFSKRFAFETMKEIMLNIASSNDSQSIDKQLVVSITDCLKKTPILESLYLNLEKNKIKDRDCVILAEIFLYLPLLKNLHLYLACNQISDEGIEALTEKLSVSQAITQLYLDFRQNNIASLGYLNIAQTINKFPHLTHTYLNFNGNSIEPEGVEYFFSYAELGQMTHLSLDFSNCQISARSNPFISNALSKLNHNLTFLNLNFCNNYLEAGGMERIISSIKNTQKLQHLEINFNWNICNIKDDVRIKNSQNNGNNNQQNLSSEEIGDEIENNVNWLSDIQALLQNNSQELLYFSFSIANCLVESLGVDYLSTGLNHCTNLSILSLNLMNNRISTDGYQSLFRSLKTMSLSYLKIVLDDNNSMSSRDGIELEKMLKVQKNIRDMHLSCRKIEFLEDSMKNLAKGINSLQKLNTLHLDFKSAKLPPKHAKDISSLLNANKTIFRIHLDISENGFDAAAIADILKNLQKNKNLRCLTFYAQNNRVLAKGMSSLAKQAGIKKLRYLDMNLLNCEIENAGLQELLTFLSQFKNLHSLKLNVWNNSLTYQQTPNILAMIAALPTLDYLSLNIGENEFYDEDLVQLYLGFEKKQQLSYLELNLINISKGRESRRQLAESLNKMNNIKSCNVIPFQSNLRQDLIFHETMLSGFNETQICTYSFSPYGHFYACGHGQYNIIRRLKNQGLFEENLVLERIIDGDMLESIFQHLPKTIQTVHLINMNAALVPILQARLHEINSKATVTSSGINGLLVISKSHKHNFLQLLDQSDMVIKDQNIPMEKSQLKRNNNGTLVQPQYQQQQQLQQFDIEEQVLQQYPQQAGLPLSQPQENKTLVKIIDSMGSLCSMEQCEEAIGDSEDRKISEFQQLVKVQINQLQLSNPEQFSSRFIETPESYWLNTHTQLLQDTQTKKYVMAKRMILNKYLQNQIEAHQQLNNIFQMHMKNYSQILPLLFFHLDSQEFIYITKPPKITMKNFLKNQPQPISESDCLKWFGQLVEAISNLEDILDVVGISMSIDSVCLDEADNIILCDIGGSEESLFKSMESSLKSYRQRAIDLSITLLDFKNTDFDVQIFSLGLFILQLMTRDTNIRLIEKQYYTFKIEDLIFITASKKKNQKNYNFNNSNSSNGSLGGISNNTPKMINHDNNDSKDSIIQDDKSPQADGQQVLTQQQYSSGLIQLVQDCIFHQEVQKYRLYKIDIAYVRSTINMLQQKK